MIQNFLYTLSPNNSYAERRSIIYNLVKAEERSEEIYKSVDKVLLDMGKKSLRW